MGGSQSTPHTVTIDNDDLSAIQVSKAVTDRLMKGVKSNESNTPSNSNKETKSEQIKQTSYNIPSASLQTQFISSLDIQKHLHKAIDDNNKYWESQIDKLNKSYDKITDNMTLEYEKTLRDVETILPSVSKEKKQLSCLNEKEKLLRCYQINSKQSLNCMQHVNTFTNCILENKA